MSTDSPPSGPRSCVTTVLSFIAFAVAATALIILPTGLIGPVFVIGGIAFFGLLALHYLVWGRWIRRELQKSEESAEDRPL